MPITVEYKIRIKIILIFLVVAAYFSGVFVYLERMKNTINVQREEIEDISTIINKTNALIFSIQQTQNITNAYLFSHNKSDLERYKTAVSEVNRQIEELAAISSRQEQSEQILEEIRALLGKKNDIVKRLSVQFMHQNPMQDLNVKIDSIQENVRDTVVLTTVRRDSITLPSQVKKTEKKRDFWSRVRNVFKPAEEVRDTTIKIIGVGTTHKTTIDTMGMFSDLRSTSNKVTEDYLRQIADIESRVRQLIVADSEIFSQISRLLTRFHEETVQSVFIGTWANEALTHKVLRFATNLGGLSLLLILLIIVLIIDDLNKGQKARRALVKEKQLTEQLTESRHKLLLTVSHDIKTPLSSMIGYMDLWRTEEADTAKKRQLQSALSSGEHILNMLANLLEYSRLEKQAYQPKTSEFDLPALCGDVIEMFLSIAREKGLALRYSNRIGTEYYVRADHTSIRQILSNILSNAIKYTIEGSVDLLLEKNDNTVVFCVTDTGVGIDGSKVANAFRPFSRMDNPVSTEGSGFGLYVTKGLIDAMGGTILMQSEIGKGTRVTVTLPLEKTNTPKVQENTETPSLPSRKTLVFEDDASLGNMLVEIMRRMGLEVTLCGNSDINRLELMQFDTVFTDMEMGDINGTDVLAAVRKINKEIPVWLITAHGEITESNAQQAGFSGLISKPVTISSLETALKLNDGHLTRENSGEEFPLLSAMFDGDQESVNDVLRQFVSTADTDVRRLQTTVGNSDFAGTRQVCHKILPFLAQLDSPRLDLSPLKTMNSLKDTDESSYPGWQKQMDAFIAELIHFAEWVKTRYPERDDKNDE